MKSTMKRALVFTLLPLLLVGCASSSPPARFYTLQALVPPVEHGSIDFGDQWVGIGPVRVPDYLDRPQIVTRGDVHRIQIHEFDRWADRVGDRILTVLMENVARLSDSKRVAPYPWAAAFRPDRRVVGEILAFEADSSGGVVLRTRWLVGAPGAPVEGDVRVSEYMENAATGDFDSITAAMSRALQRWSVDIAKALAVD
jgi:uncharacterized lipoprotein YmbA